MKGSGKTLEVSFTKSSGKKLLENILLASNIWEEEGRAPSKVILSYFRVFKYDRNIISPVIYKAECLNVC